jgi:drug/metabolite transporter (DMT)-like permease
LQTSHLGELLSIAAAVIWAGSVVLFRMSARSLGPLALNFFKNIVATLLLLATLAVLRQELVRAVPVLDYCMLLAAGVVGITVADTLFLRGLNLVGAGRSQIVSSSYSPFVIALSFVFLGERLSPGDLAGTAFILFGIVLSARRVSASEVSPADMRKGIIVSTISFALMALGVVLTKPVLDRSPVLWATTIRLLGGVAGLVLIAIVSPKHRYLWRSLRPSRSWRITIPASVMGAYIAMLVWLAGMKFTQASTAAILNQLSAVFVLPIAAVFLKEPVTKQKLGAVASALAGVVLVTFF